MAKASAGRILIAGGGIGGLALSLALARIGRDCVVLEGWPEFSIAGAGIQLGPNGVRVLQDLGVADVLASNVGAPDAIHVYRGTSGRRLARMPLGSWIAERHGAPYWVAHRADLHAALLGATVGNPRIAIRTGFAVSSIRQGHAGVEVVSEAGETVAGDALVGADGLWSTVRGEVAPDTAPIFAGASASRAVLPAAAAGRLAENAVGLWLSPRAHVVHYPVRGGADVAVVVIAQEFWQSRVWDAEADRRQLATHLGTFAPELQETLLRTADWRRWSLHRLPSLPAWNKGRVVLIGDAAHPMFPYLAQGGVLALEDAAGLAKLVAAYPEDLPRAFADFSGVRRARAERVQRASQRNGRIYHLSGAMEMARDAVLATAPSNLLMAGFDWLYGWKA